MSQLNPLSCSRDELIKLVNIIAIKHGWGNVLDIKILNELERQGLPKENGRYSIFDLAVFLIMRYTAENENTLQTRLDRYKSEIIGEVMAHALNHKEG